MKGSGKSTSAAAQWHWARAAAARERLDKLFRLRWAALRGPALEPEYRFSPDRRWRFDFAHPATRIAIELDGGTWNGGRHVQGAGFAADAEKHNAAMAAGWRVWHLTGEMISARHLEMIAHRILAESAITVRCSQPGIQEGRRVAPNADLRDGDVASGKD